MKTKTLIIASFLIASLHAQEKPADPYRPPSEAAPEIDWSAATRDPFTLSEAEIEAERKANREFDAFTLSEAERKELEELTRPTNISICFEAFSLPLAMAAELQREQLADPALYAKMVAGLGDKSIRQEIMQVIRAKSGQKAFTESVSEHIYATEYEPGKISNSEADTPEEPKADAKPGTEMAGVASLPAVPTSFETRNLGNMLEVEPTMDEYQKFVDLRLFPEQVTLVGRTTQGQGFSTVEMPEFEKNSINTRATMRINQPFLLGTNSRPPVSKVDPDSANRVWFAFVTVTLVKP